jgi:hypothetical protein
MSVREQVKISQPKQKKNKSVSWRKIFEKVVANYGNMINSSNYTVIE